MTRHTILTTLAAILLIGGVLIPGVTMAEDGKKAEAKAAAETAPANPTLAKVEKQAKALIENLGQPELKHLYFIKESFGSTSAVKIVRRDVGNAVKECGKANPDMKAKLDARFQEWTNAVDPAVKEKEKAIDDAIAQQTYAKPKDIKDYLKTIQQAADEANRNLEKKVITTPEACNGLLESMDRTQEVVQTLITEMKLRPWPPVAEDEPPAGKISIPN